MTHSEVYWWSGWSEEAKKNAAKRWKVLKVLKNMEDKVQWDIML